MATATVDAPRKQLVDTKKVQGRRTVRYESYDELMAEAERLAGQKVRTLGNWTYPQILDHMAKAIHTMMDGVHFGFPLPLRVIMRLTMKKRMLRETIPSGFKFPEKAAPAIDPPETATLEQGLADLRAACERAKSTATRTPHPAFGKMTREEWDAFQLRHCEMHMSFVVP